MLFSVVLCEDSLEEAGNRITGRLAISVENWRFPDPQWNDFVVTVLSWWIRETVYLLVEADATVELRFMDGPFWVVASRPDSGTDRVRLAFTEGRAASDVVIGRAEVPIDEFARAIANAAKRVIEACERRGLTCDVGSLQEALRQMQRIFR